MAELATYGIFVGIVAALLAMCSRVRPELFLAFMIYPVVLADAFTGQRGSLTSNGPTSHSPATNPLLAFFGFLQVLLVAGILYGIYRLMFEPIDISSAEIFQELTALEVRRLQLINTALWFLAFTLMLTIIVNMIRFRQRLKTFSGWRIFSIYVLPLVAFPLEFLFLAHSRHYLANYPTMDLNGLSKGAAIFYSIYSAGLLARDFYHMVVYKTYRQSALGVLLIALGLIYKVMFIYFVVCMFASF